MENQHVINMLGIKNQQVYNNRRDINNLMELWTTIRDQLSPWPPVYNPMIATLYGGGFSITNIQDLVANGSGTFGGTLTVSGATALGGSLTVTGITNLNNNLNVTGTATISNTTPASGTGSGAHVVQGGASVTLDFYVGQDLNVTGNTILNGTLDVYKITTINSITQSTTSTNGALVVTGGAGIGLNLNVGGNARVMGTLTVEQATQLNSDTDMHLLVRAHGAGDVTSTGPTNSTAVKIMSGGMSVAKSVYISNNLYINQNATVTGTLTVSDATTLDSTLSVGSNATVTGSLTVNANTFLGATNTNTLTVNAVSTFLNNVFISSGDLIVQPGSSFLSDLVVNGASTFVGLVTTNNATVTGTLTVTGFTNLQDTLTVASNAIITSTLDVYGITTLHNTLNAVSNANVTGTLNVYGDTILGVTGANTLTVNAPATFQESVRVNGQLYAHNTAESISTSSGALIVNGGVGINKKMYLGGHLHAQSSTQSTSTSNGAFILSGGAGIARNVNIGGDLSVTGNTTLSALTATTIATAANNTSTLGNLTVTTLNATSTAVATNTTSGSITTLGGVGIAKNVYIGSTLNVTGNSSLAATTCSGQLRITDTTNVSFTHVSNNVGAVIVDGGVGIKQDLLVNGYIFANGQTTEPYAIRAGGQIAIQYDMGTTVSAIPTNQGLEIYNAYSSDVIGKESMIAFYNTYSGINKTSRGAISAGAQATGTDCSGYLGFYTNGNTVNSLTQRMKLTSEGHLAIGTDSISNAVYHLDVNSGSENICARFASTGTAVKVLFAGSTGTSYIEAINDFRFGNNSREFMRISSDGNVSINTTDTTYRLQIKTDPTVSDDGIRLLVGNPGDGLTIKTLTTPVAFIGEANAGPTDGGQISLFNNSGTEDIRLMNAGAAGTDVRCNWIRTVSTNSRLIIGEFNAAATSVHSNTYSGVTITGLNPSLALTATAASAWTWLQYINSSGTTTFSSGVNQTIEPHYIIKYGHGVGGGNGFAIGVNTSQQVTISATSGSGSYYGHLTIQSASGTFTTNCNDLNYARVGLALSQEVDVTDKVGSAILWTKKGGGKVAAISNYFYGDTDQSGLVFFVQPSASSVDLKEAMCIDNNGNVYIGNKLNGVAEDTSYIVNIARGQGGSGNLLLQGDNYAKGAPRLAFENELTPGGAIYSANIFLDSINQIVTSSPFKITTGTSVNSVDVTNQENGSIIFTNGSVGAALPSIVAKSTHDSGLVITTSTPETPSSNKDIQFNVVNNTGGPHAQTTQTAYSFNAVGS